MRRNEIFVSLPRIVITSRPRPVPAPKTSVTIWINNGNGSRSPVVLVKDGPWYVGPRGERYFALPNEEQLRPLYGLNIRPVRPSQLTIYITAGNGTQIPVTLVANEKGYVGPKGEVYTSLPTERQLQMVYGK
jgi:hypothetical protein